MEDNSQTLATNPNKKPRSSTTSSRYERVSRRGRDEDEDEECDLEAWQTLSKSFKDVESVLDQNRCLIQQVNENHQSKLHENMVKNVGLIREIKGNISKVMGMYEDLNANFTTTFHQRRSDSGNKKDISES